ncbi:sensor histidine kinase [Streptomyces sp. NPDC026672]|uniref:sensor histidine kinase n=1 Tax=unclassified Streptomyces TaxID=2593676 RepID=UPI0033C935A5
MDDLHPRWPPVPPLGRRGLIAADTAACLLFTAVLAGLTVSAHERPPAAGTAPLWVPLVLAAGIGLPGAVRRVWPRGVFALVLTASVLSAYYGDVPEPFVAASFALYTVAVGEPRRRWLPTPVIGAVSLLALLAATLGSSPGRWQDGTPLLIVGCALMGGAWTVGRAVRERRASAVRLADQVTQRAVAEERLRIARELHDVVTHSMGVIAVKAGVANHLGRERPEVAYEALAAIETVSRGALGELRQLLGVLRTQEPEKEAELRPVPVLDGLPGLVEQAEMAGLHVELTVTGTERLPGGTELTVYRIVQEALTNAVKHAAPAHCRVLVTADGHEVTAEITDDGRTGPGRGAPTTGLGLVGMRERVAGCGGVFEAGPRRGGGYRVLARIPYEPTVRSEEDLT